MYATLRSLEGQEKNVPIDMLNRNVATSITMSICLLVCL